MESKIQGLEQATGFVGPGHGQSQGLLCAGVTPSVSEAPGWPSTALGNLKAGQMDEQAEGRPFPACALLTEAPDWPGLGQG